MLAVWVELARWSDKAEAWYLSALPVCNVGTASQSSGQARMGQVPGVW